MRMCLFLRLAYIAPIIPIHKTRIRKAESAQKIPESKKLRNMICELESKIAVSKKNNKKNVSIASNAL